jgi:TRAP transporter TAXI family solute receptor
MAVLVRERDASPVTRAGQRIDRLLRSVATFLLSATLASCHTAAAPHRRTVRMLTGPSSYAAQELATYYRDASPGIDIRVEATDGSRVVVTALNENRGDVGLAQADVVYSAYRQGTPEASHPFTNLRGVAVLWPSKLYVVVRKDSTLAAMRDLRGHRVGIDVPGSSAEAFARNVLAAHHLSYTDLKVHFGPTSTMPADVEAGTLDAAILPSPLIDFAAQPQHSTALRLLPIRREDTAAYRFTHPFLKPVIVPAFELPSENHAVETIGSDGLLICSKDVSEELVYEITKMFFASLPRLAERFAPAALVNPEHAPTTPIPLHPGAARYYRERQILR